MKVSKFKIEAFFYIKYSEYDIYHFISIRLKILLYSKLFIK